MPDTRLMQVTDKNGHQDENLFEEFVGLLSCRFFKWVYSFNAGDR